MTLAVSGRLGIIFKGVCDQRGSIPPQGRASGPSRSWSAAPHVCRSAGDPPVSHRDLHNPQIVLYLSHSPKSRVPGIFSRRKSWVGHTGDQMPDNTPIRGRSHRGSGDPLPVIDHAVMRLSPSHLEMVSAFVAMPGRFGSGHGNASNSLDRLIIPHRSTYGKSGRAVYRSPAL